METLTTLLNLACGRAAAADEGQARKLQLIVAAGLSALGFAALWGLAAGSGSLGMAMANAYKVPLVVLLSSLTAVPAGLLANKLTGVRCRTLDLLLAFAVSVLSGSMVLAAMSPLVAMYYHTSAWAGPFLAMGSSFVALGVATVVFVRGALFRVPDRTHRAAVLIPVLVFVVMQSAAMLQLIAMASPILPEVTVFDGGVDQMVGR